MTATPNGTEILAFNTAALDALEEPVDLTEAVKVLYDHVVNSMDWGSGFLDHEEQHRVYDIGKALGFELPDMECHRELKTFHDGTYGTYQKYVDTGRCRFENIDEEEG